MKKQKPKKLNPNQKPAQNKTVVSQGVTNSNPQVTENVEATKETVWAEAVGGAPQSAQCPHHKNAENNKIIAYTLGFPPSPSRPGPAQREFMDSTSNRFAYRCLPLNICLLYTSRCV